jgi:hypothetical protein
MSNFTQFCQNIHKVYMRRYSIFLRDGKHAEIEADYFKQDLQTDETWFYCFGKEGKEDEFVAVFRYWMGIHTFIK